MSLYFFLSSVGADCRPDPAYHDRNIPSDDRLRHRGLRILQRTVRIPHRFFPSLVFKSGPLFRDRLCGYNLTLKYPETQKYPTIIAPLGGYGSTVAGSSRSQLRYSSFASAFRSRLRTNLAKAPANLDKRKRELSQREWKRDLSTRPNGTIDPWYGCDLFDFVIDYALNYTYPWTNNTPLGFDVSGNC